MNEHQKAAIAKLLSLRADNTDDVQFLAEAIDNLGVQHRPAYAAMILTLGLMLPQGEFGAAVQMIQMSGLDAPGAMLFAFENVPALADELIEQTAEHCLHGEDTEDPDSVGGWSQREVTLAAKALIALAFPEVTLH